MSRDQPHVTLYHGVAGSAAKVIRSQGLKPPTGEGLAMCETPAQARQLALSMAAWLAIEGIAAVDHVAIVAATVKRARLGPEPTMSGLHWHRGRIRPPSLRVLSVLDTAKELPDDEQAIERMAAQYGQQSEAWQRARR